MVEEEVEAGTAGSRAKGFGFFRAVETKPLQKCRRAERKLGLVHGPGRGKREWWGQWRNTGPPCSLTSGHRRLRELAREIPFRLVRAISPVSNVGSWFQMSRTPDGAKQTHLLAQRGLHASCLQPLPQTDGPSSLKSQGIVPPPPRALRITFPTQLGQTRTRVLQSMPPSDKNRSQSAPTPMCPSMPGLRTALSSGLSFAF